MVDTTPVRQELHYPLARAERTLWSDASRRFRRNRMASAGTAICGAIALVGLFAPLLAPHDPLVMNLGDNFLSPSREHLFGTDELGRDVLSRIVYAARYDLGLTALTVFIAAGVGVITGTAAAYRGGILDMILMRSVDILLAFPVFLLGLVLVTFLGPSMLNLILALAITRFPRYARLIRGLVLSTQRREYVEAARIIGASDVSIVIRHILPNSVSPIIIYATLDMGTTITALAGLSFLGVGMQAPDPDWGLMLTTARNNLFLAPWTAIFPGLAIFITTIGFNSMGDGLRDAFDPRLQR